MKNNNGFVLVFCLLGVGLFFMFRKQQQQTQYTLPQGTTYQGNSTGGILSGIGSIINALGGIFKTVKSANSGTDSGGSSSGISGDGFGFGADTYVA